MNLAITPCGLSTANALVTDWHRHSRPVVGHLYSLALIDTDEAALHGAVIIGRPVARHLDDGVTVEITRCVTDGTRNACSMLYGAACREARRRGYRLVVTYTLAAESGSSLRAANFAPAGAVRGRQWDTPTRRRAQRHAADRIRWERRL